MNIVGALIIRLTHTGLKPDGSPNLSSVTLYDLDEPTASVTRPRAIPVPVGSGSTLPPVDIAMSTRTFLSWADGAICKFVQNDYLTAEIILQLRDKGNCGGPAGTGQALRPAVLNAERTGNVLRLVIPDNVIPTVLDSVGFLVNEDVDITGFTGAFLGLDGTHTITVASPGFGLAGAVVGSYLLEFESVGPDIAATTLTGVNLCLTNGRVTVEMNANGDTGGLGTNVFGYIGGQLFPNAGAGAGTITILDEGILIDAAAASIDFVGAGVTATGGAGAVTVTIPGGGGAVTLQTAYVAGNTIVTSAPEGPLDVSGTEAISLDAGAASNFTVAGANLDLSTTTSGSVLIDGVGGVELNSSGGALQIGNDADTGAVDLGTGAAARVITIGNATGATGVTVNTGTGAFDLNSTVAETVPLATLTTTGVSGDSVDLFVGDNDPSGSVTGQAGSLFFRDTGTTGELYLNTSTATGTTWDRVTTAGTEATGILYWGNNSVASSTAARILDPGFEARTAPLTSSGSFAQVRMTRPGTLRNLYVDHGAPGGSGAVLTYTIRVNGTPTALSVGVATTAAGGSDTVSTVAVVAGDRVDVEVTKAATAGGGSRIPEVSVELAA